MMRYCLILLLITLASCNDNGVAKVEEREGGRVVSIETDDKKMIAATEEAVRNYPLFEQALQGPDSTLTDFAVRMKFSNGNGETEHLWLNRPHRLGGQLFGVVNSEPMHVKGVEMGDTIRIVRSDITDWMYVKNRKLQGGYTLKVMYNSMDEKTKKQFRNSVPFEIE